MKATAPLVAVEQSGIPPPLTPMDVAAQNISDSGMIPVRIIGFAVLAVTVPVSTAVPVVSVLEYDDIRTKNDVLTAAGLVTPFRGTVTAVLLVKVAAVLVIYGDPAAVLLIVKPLNPLVAPSAAAVVTRPIGIVQVPLAVVQYWNLMEPSAVVPVGSVKVKI